ncbi:hypothetical protein AMS68_007978 [Peltaster fructicola]|uniref:Myb-like domain-containing protein n=1 Tax=Peltaster fructicola TaxID=286661 RepID=A0A6H0Y6I9_9PEZI|nr:hypothetical protein AMS68_007978 [Peltaster fructicola]
MYSNYAPGGAPAQVELHAGSSNKRVAGPHPGESPAKKKQSKWTADEDASIIELRGNGMKWEDISKHLPGRSAISCRLRFQNYLERRSEWDEEKKNKLARLYERCVGAATLESEVNLCSRFKKDMWEKIAKEMQLPWRAAEAMHWQIGEVEMAQRANVPVFHLAGQANGHGPASDHRNSTSPSSTTLAPPLAYIQTHNHTLPHVGHPLLPTPPRRDSLGNMPSDEPRHRVAGGHAVMHTMPHGRTPSLPPLGDITSSLGSRYSLPPVVTSAELVRR